MLFKGNKLTASASAFSCTTSHTGRAACIDHVVPVADADEDVDAACFSLGASDSATFRASKRMASASLPGGTRMVALLCWIQCTCVYLPCLPFFMLFSLLTSHFSSELDPFSTRWPLPPCSSIHRSAGIVVLNEPRAASDPGSAGADGPSASDPH